MNLAFLIAVFCYGCMQLVETFSFGSRVAGKLTGNLALGTTLQHTIFICSRVFLPPLLLAISFQIESGETLENFMFLSALMTGLGLVLSILILTRLNSCQRNFQIIFYYSRDYRLPTCIWKLVFNDNRDIVVVNRDLAPKFGYIRWPKLLASGFAYFFIATSFLLAFSIALIFPDYRLTISQFSSAFHGIGAGFLALYIDPMISRSLDVAEDQEVWLANVFSVLAGRICSLGLAFFIFFLSYCYMDGLP